MMDFSSIVSTPTAWVVLALSALIIGMSKTGIQGITTLVIPILALCFGGKPSTGIILPLLCMADVIAVIYYRRDAEWKYILRLLPAAIVGFFVALAVDSVVPQEEFKRLMAACVGVGIVIMFWSERKGKEQIAAQASAWWYGPLFGLLGGFTTMIGNAAGPIMAIYLLMMHLPKNAYVGTSAWFFLIVNLLKVPLQIFVWNNITLTTIAVDLMLLPFIGLGAVLGIYLVKRLPESSYRKLIIWLTIISTAMLLI